MPADMGADSSAPNLNLSPEEKRAFGQLFRQADTDGVGVVTGEIAVKFFEKTRLDSRVLGEIWQIADKENRGFLTPAGFGIVLRLIGHAQAGREPSAELALQRSPLPRFDGIVLNTGPAPSQAPLQSQNTGAGRFPPPPQAPLQSQNSGTGRFPPLTPDKVAQYSALFERQPLQNGQLPGEQARLIFDKSGLSNDALGKIWELSDTEQRGALVQAEFVIAMHLLTSMKSRALLALPNVLPPALYEAATLRSAPRQSPNNTGMSGMSPIPRQMSGTAQPRTASPLGGIAHIPPQSTGGQGDWAVTPTDKARFDQIYNDLDKTNKGFITGEEAVPFLSKSELPEDTLAQIWDFADYNSQGNLTREGFAVAMYLIRQLRTNRMTALPPTLPPNLLPPSARNRSQQGTPTFEPPKPAPPPPPPKSALDDLFGLDSSAPSPAATGTPTPAQALSSMSTGGSAANDPFAGGSSILAPSSPARAPTNFKQFVPSSSFGRGLTSQNTGDQPGQASATEDLLADNDPEASKKITGETTELANLSNQIGTLSKQMQENQTKRGVTQNELNQTNSQKQNFEQRLAQLRTLYEKEANDTHALEEQLRNSRSETQKLQGECMTLDVQYKDVQAQHQQLVSALQADQQENATLRETIRKVNAEIAQLKPQIEKLKSEARQQKGLVSINKKQLSTTEGERDKLKHEVDDLTKSNAELSRQAETSSPVSVPDPVASPAGSTASGNNPFFKRSASTDIMGAFASPPPRNYSDKSFDEVFGTAFAAPSASTPPPATSFKQSNPETSSIGSFSTPPASSPVLSRQGTMASEPPAPPEFRQIDSGLLPFSDPTASVSTSRQVSPPTSHVPSTAGDETPEVSALPGAFPAVEDFEKSQTPVSGVGFARPPTADAQKEFPKAVDDEAASTSQYFGNADRDEDKAKADFDNAFAAFTSSSKGQNKPASTASPAPPAAFSTEFPPISELEGDDSDSSDDAGFDDDFSPVAAKSPPPAAAAEQRASEASAPIATPAGDDAPAVPTKDAVPKTQR
jgi:epidermal growth factor receptor substrate 15